MLRELKSNIPKRIPALEKPNEMHLNKTDAIFFKTRSYKNIIFEDFFSLDYLKRFQDKSHRVVKHEDLITRKKNVMKKFCKYVSISNSKSLLNSTINNLTWNYKHDNKVELKNGVAKDIVYYNKKNFFYYELFWLNNLIKKFNKKYSYKTNKEKFTVLKFNIILSFFFIFLPSKKELNLFTNFFTFKFMKSYMEALYLEVFKIKLKLYEKNAFYFLKWSNKNLPFLLINFLNTRLNQKKNVIWIFFYILLKLLMFVFIPVVIILEYFLRIVFCLMVYFKNILGLRFFPKKL